MVSINWHDERDDDDNTVWVGASPYTDGGDAIYWRLKQRLRGNRIEWYAAHDAELGGETGDSWLCVDDAKDACQKAHEEIIAREA